MTVETSLGPAEDFAGRLFGILNSGMLSLMIGIGHRTGLFDTMAGLPPSSSVEIAGAAGLDERYVREWLGAMTTGRIVEHDHTAGAQHRTRFRHRVEVHGYVNFLRQQHRR